MEDVNTYRQGKWGEGEVDEIARAQAKQSAKVELDVRKASWSDFTAHYREWKHLKVLLGCALSWFFLVSLASSLLLDLSSLKMSALHRQC